MGTQVFARSALGSVMSTFHPRAHKRKRMIMSFVKKNDLVHFGHVDQHQDEHQIIRGITASTYHSDNHFIVGTIDDYDVRFVDRTDRYSDADQHVMIIQNFIAAITLKNTSAYVPRFFIVPNKYRALPQVAYVPGLQRLPLTVNAPSEFTSRYDVLCSAEYFNDVYEILTHDVMAVFAAHFWPLAVEIDQNTLYVYAHESNISEHTLQTMVRMGCWLSTYIDTKDKK